MFYLLRLKIKHLFALGGKKGHVHRLEFVVDVYNIDSRILLFLLFSTKHEDETYFSISFVI